MKILFADNTLITLDVDDSPVKNLFIKFVKHLQHIDVDFKSWNNPYDNSSPVDLLTQSAKKLNIKLNQNLLNDTKIDQNYLNYLHTLYEKNYNGHSIWHEYHENIHRCELNSWLMKKTAVIDWREKGGPLVCNFDYNWLSESKTHAKTGDVYIQWSELGKTPYVYWLNREPDDINRICELAKPWITLQPKFYISLENRNFVPTAHRTEFEKWWSKYHDCWCKHWNIPSWTLNDQYSIIKIGNIRNIKKMENLLKNYIAIKRVLL